jgi:hypothetical protein
MQERKAGGWTHGWFMSKLDQEFCLTYVEKDAICKALGYRAGYTVEVEHVLYRQWQKDQIISQILDYHNTPSLSKIFPKNTVNFDSSVGSYPLELAL